MFRSEQVGFSLAGGLLAVIAATVVASLVFTAAETAGRLSVVMLAVCCHAARGVRVAAAVATVVMAWLFTTGFLVNSAGELTFDGPGLSRLGLLAVAALAGGGYAVFHRAPVAQRRESTSVPSAQHDHAGDMTVSHPAQMAHLR
ncbi:hypothetical protein [Streptosporangium sp. NPDC006007]|uniref:hypothetical protein n=1 Tax=Streptosporangium sp. NPDC006007 TaxID=3154575 RepID=UPI0033A97E13